MLVSGENADGFRRFDHARAKVLSNIKYKEIGVHLARAENPGLSAEREGSS